MIAAIVVLFHPDPEAIERQLSSLIGQVSTVFAIDNTPGSTAIKPAFLAAFGEAVSYVPLGENRGIAEAQNIGIALSMKSGYSHVLLLDQDSVLAPDMVERLLAAEEKLLGKGERLAALAPQIVDERASPRPCAFRYTFWGVRKIFRDVSATEPVQTDNLIASGSLIQTATLQTLGTMRSDLFIDHVDTEWALRARSAGYQSYSVPNAVLTHSLGDGVTKLWGKDIHLHNDVRHYYQLRNEVYLARLKTMGWQWRAYILTRIPYHFVVYSAFSEHRLRASCFLLKAIWEGILGKLGPLTET
jgi:rhamnosyltransferase